MLMTTNITETSQAGSSAYLNQPALFNGFLTGANPAQFPMVWCATARSRDISLDGPLDGNINNEACRTAQTCYMRGLSESIEIQVADGLPWQWRRICFTTRGLVSTIPESTVNGSAFQHNTLFTSGYQRTMNLLPSTGMVAAFEALLFKGVKGQDWIDPMLAQIDNLRVDVKYNKTISIASGNEDGIIRKYKRWHPMNKNLTYDDDESGASYTDSKFSVKDKRGMGDYYVVDYFTPRVGAATTNRLRVGINSTLYWHER